MPRSAALGLRGERSSSDERAKQLRATVGCFALSGLGGYRDRKPGAALPAVAVPQAGLWLPLRGVWHVEWSKGVMAWVDANRPAGYWVATSETPRRGSDKSAQGRAERRMPRSAALGLNGERSSSPVRAAQGRTTAGCFALSGLGVIGVREPGAALPAVSVPQAGLWLPLRGVRHRAIVEWCHVFGGCGSVSRSLVATSYTPRRGNDIPAQGRA